MKLGVKSKRNIGLIAITLAVIVAIILIVYFTQKSDDDSALKRGGIGQTISINRADIVVMNMELRDAVGDLRADEGRCFFVINVAFKAKAKLVLSPESFEVIGGRQVFPVEDGTSFFSNSLTLKKGEECNVNLAYEVESDRIESFYLKVFNAKIDLGGSNRNVFEKNNTQD